jgi:hypothetical protein
MDNKLKKLILGYDILFPYCEVPNCLDPKDLQFAKDCDYYYDNSQTYFKEKLNKEWYIHNGRFMVHLNDESGDPGYFAIDKKSTYDIIKDRERGKDYDWYYLIEAYGDFNNFLGLSNSNPQPFSEFIPSHTLNELKNYNGKLIINFAIDGGLSTLKVDRLYECLLNLNIPKEKIIILHNDFNLEKLMKPIFGEYMPTLIHYCWSLNSKSEEYFKKTHQTEFHFWNTDDRKTNYSFLTNDECKDLSKKTHKFLNLNRRLRIHRIDLLYFLWKENMLDDVLISYDSKLFTHDGLDMIRKKLSIEEWNDFYHYIVHTSPRIVDYYDIESIWGYGFETKEIYEKSLISILSETFFYEESGYLSEKIWKPIAHGHPFILIGPQNSLKFIKKEFGFKTFHPFINEAYDAIEDGNLRMEMIQKEIKRLNSYSLEELKKIVEQVIPIILHNKQKLLEYGKKSMPLDYVHYLRIVGKTEEAEKIFNKQNQLL